MIERGDSVAKTNVVPIPIVAPARAIVTGILFGFAFGFLLQKGGVGTYYILIGQLLLQDWTVVKIMATAIGVGMIGIFVLNRLGKVKRAHPADQAGAQHHRRAAVRCRIWPDRLLSGDGRGGAQPRQLGRAVRHGRACRRSWIYAELSEGLQASVECCGNLGS